MSENDLELKFRTVDIVINEFGNVGDVLKITIDGKAGFYRLTEITDDGTVKLEFIPWSDVPFRNPVK